VAVTPLGLARLMVPIQDVVAIVIYYFWSKCPCS